MTLFVNFSVVSHMHGHWVLECLHALGSHSVGSGYGLRVWITLNKPEPELERSIRQTQWPFDVRIIKNTKPLGFGDNHNQAFAHAQALGRGDWFVVMNPDVLWPANAQLFWQQLAQDTWPANVGLLCPQQTTADGALQDFARKLPTPWGLLGRSVRRLLRLQPSGVALAVETADWVNGACMVWRAPVFAALCGFDERYHLYGEDVDICLRLQLAGYTMSAAPVAVVHHAQRQTGRSWRHLAWHVGSLAKLWGSASFWQYVWRGVRRTQSVAKYNSKL
jgi:N-acetylglucosaminyl-diphospho-decaprenol L-rhamnosyltransferase